MKDAVEILLLILTTSALTALINQVLGGWFGERKLKREQDHQKGLQLDQREHDRKLRLADAHDKARESLLEDAAGALDWISYEWGKEHGLDSDWVPEHDPLPAFSSVTDVIAASRKIELRHPTKKVRKLARKMREGVSANYGSIEAVWNRRLEVHEHMTGVAPGPETFKQWVDLGEALIEAMHEPPE